MDYLDELTTEQPNPASVGIDRKSSREILEIINREDKMVPTAIVMVLLKVSRDRAEQLLNRHKGSINAAVKTFRQ